MSENQATFPKPPKAYKNLEFLTSHEARSIRIQCELEEPQIRFKEEGIENTIVFFGSARTPDPETQESPSRQSRFYGDARELSRRLQHINLYSPKDLSFEFHYFFIRKYWFLYMAKAVVAFPGGVGTMDELFESLTLVQTGKVTKEMPIILYGSEFWQDVVNFDKLVEWGTISPGDVNLFRVIDTVDEAFDYLTSELQRQAPAG